MRAASARHDNVGDRKQEIMFTKQFCSVHTCLTEKYANFRACLPGILLKDDVLSSSAIGKLYLTNSEECACPHTCGCSCICYIPYSEPRAFFGNKGILAGPHKFKGLFEG